MAKWNETPEFRRLQRHWYRKLKRANHRDIEEGQRGDFLRYETGVRRWRAGERDDLPLAMAGADVARSVLPLLPNRERAIMARLAKGQSYDQIADAEHCSCSLVRQVVDLVNRARRERDERDRAILGMRADGATYRQIAGHLGVDQKVVRAVIVAARRARGEEE